MSVAYLALGSNVGDRLQHLRSGKDSLVRLGNIVAVSPVYDTEPVGTSDGDRFLNAVVAVRTQLSPEELLSKCLEIEQENGRTRTVQNAPRTLDIDILLYDDLQIENSDLTLPHPRMHERAFVLTPLADIASDVVHPRLDVTIRALLAECPSQDIVRTNDRL